jgi:TonB family protein
MKKNVVVAGMVLFCCVWSCSSQKRVKPPRVQSDVKLDYPVDAQMERKEGQVDLAVFVNSKGKPDEIRVYKSSGHEILDSAAVTFTRTVIFDPAEVDGKSVSAWTRLVLRYHLTEVPFEQSRWLSEVLHYHKQAGCEPDSAKREAIYRRLYTNYLGLMSFAENRSDMSINEWVRQIIDSASDAHWQPIWKHYVAAFVVWDDFLLRYPDSALAAHVKEQLTKYLLDVLYKIRVDSLRSNSKARKGLPLIALIEERLQQLGFTPMP